MNSFINGGASKIKETRFVYANVTEYPQMLFSFDLLTCVQQVTAFFFTGGSRASHKEVEIPTEYKGLVIGKYGANLLEISKETGAEVIHDGGEVYIIQGTKQQRDQAKLLIKRKVVGSLVKFLFLLNQ